MKNLISLLVSFLIVGFAAAQAPQGINYQGVARNDDKTPKVNTNIILGFKIKDAFGAELYSETHNKTTNGVGLFTCVIGQGTPGSGSFANINWGSGAKFLEVIVNGASSGSQQLVSVPYALYAEKSGNPGGTAGGDLNGTYPNPIVDGIQGKPVSSVAPQLGQTLVWDGASWKPGIAPAPAREIAIFEYRKATSSGSPSAGFNKVPIKDGASTSNIVLNSGGNTITLKPGTYLIQGNSMAYAIGRHQVVFRNLTTQLIELLGTNEYSNQSGSYGSSSSLIYGKLTVNTETSYILDHWVQYTSSGTDGFGIEHSFIVNPPSQDNVYARVIIEKL